MQKSMSKKITFTVIRIALVVFCFHLLVKTGFEPLTAAILMFFIWGVFRIFWRIASCLLISCAMIASFIYLLIHF